MSRFNAKRIITRITSLTVLLMTLSCIADAATAKVKVEVDGAGVVNVTGSGTFAACPHGDGSGSLRLQINGGWYDHSECSAGGQGSASFSSCQFASQSFNGSNTFTLHAYDCVGEATDSFTLTLDLHPLITFVSPAGNVTEPFTVVVNATFKPLGLPGNWYGTLYCGWCINSCNYTSTACTSTDCSCKFPNAALYPFSAGTVWADAYNGVYDISKTLPITIVPIQDRQDSDKGGQDCTKAGQ